MKDFGPGISNTGVDASDALDTLPSQDDHEKNNHSENVFILQEAFESFTYSYQREITESFNSTHLIERVEFRVFFNFSMYQALLWVRSDIL